MRIAVDARISRSWDTGVGRLTEQLLLRLLERHGEHEYVLVRTAEPGPLPLDGRLRQHEVRWDGPGRGQLLAFARTARRLSADVCIHTHPLATPIHSGAPAVSLLLDLYPLVLAGAFPARVALYYRTVVQAAERAKRLVFAISESSRCDAIERLRLSPDQVRVLHLAAAPVFRPLDAEAVVEELARLGVQRPYVAYVGNLRPQKNVPRLLEAYAAVVRDLADPRPDLVIAGLDDSPTAADSLAALRRQAAELGITSRLRLLGALPDAQLAAFYNGAAVVAVPSLYEGFGLPALEAMACGCPVVAGRAGALPEVVGDAGVLVDPNDVEAIAEGLRNVLADPKRAAQLAAAGRDRAATFTWEGAADELLAGCLEAAA